LSYGTAALRKFREQQAAGPACQPSLLEQVPADAPYEEPGAVLHAWDGVRFVPYKMWLARSPIVREPQEAGGSPAIPAEAACVLAKCGDTKVWLVKEGERWLMHVGSRRTGRRRDFASPFLAHAIHTAERWYGVAGGGWRAEKECDGNGVQAADLPAPAGGDCDLVVDGGQPGR
jgi:hypothetical protein